MFISRALHWNCIQEQRLLLLVQVVVERYSTYLFIFPFFLCFAAHHSTRFLFNVLGLKKNRNVSKVEWKEKTSRTWTCFLFCAEYNCKLDWKILWSNQGKDCTEWGSFGRNITQAFTQKGILIIVCFFKCLNLNTTIFLLLLLFTV